MANSSFRYRRDLLVIFAILILAGVLIFSHNSGDSAPAWPEADACPAVPDDMYLQILDQLGKSWEYRPRVMPAFHGGDSCAIPSDSRENIKNEGGNK